VLQRPSGEEVHALAVAVPIKDDSGEVRHLHGTIQDISARKLSEAALKESEARYHALFNNMLEGYAYCRTVFEGDRLQDFIYLEVNNAFETLTGLKNVVGKKVSDVIPGFQEANRELLDLYGRVALTGTPERCETHLESLGIWMAVAAYSPEREHFVAVFDNITARKVADTALRASMEEFRTLAEAMPQIVWITRPDGRNIYFNQQWMDYTGLTREESLDHGWNKPFHPDDQQRAWDAWQHATATTGTYSLECRLRRADGVYRWWLVRGVPLQEASGRILKWFGTCTDIHDMKMAELEITRMNRALKMLSESNEALIRAEHEQELLDQICRIAVEHGGYRMAWVGYAQNDESRSIRPLAHAGVNEGFLSEVRVSWNENEPQGRGPAGQVIRGGQAVVCADLAREPRASHWLALAQHRGYRGTICLPLRDATHTFGLVVLYTAEITETSAEELRLLQEMADNVAFGIGTLRTNARVREQAALLDTAHEAIQVRDLDGRIIFWNKGAERSYGWAAGEALGRTAVELLYRNAARFREAQAALLADGEWQGEILKHTKDGREIVVEARWTLVRDAQGRPKSVLAIDTDITEKKKIESQFLRAQRMEGIGTLAGGIAHDLNNVLAPIMMSIEMLKDLVRNDDDLALLTTLQSSAQRGADLVKQVLSFARGVEGQRVTVNPLHVMRDLLAVMRDAFPKSIEVRFTSPRDPWTITGDATQMHQVFLNLCVNARDAMPGGGNLTIGMENVMLDETYSVLSPDARPGAYVMVKVEDSGTGIPPEIRDRIFEPFFTTKEIGKGTGLGLSTTLAIVKSHGGFINLYSELGKGTRFRVYLPANITESPADDVAVERRRLPRGHGELILLVDDEEAIRKVARRTLERFGYRVLVAGNGAEAVALYAQHPGEIAVVLTDMAMPIMDGPALVIALREMNPEVLIIGSSGLASDGGVTTAAGAWVHHYVPKPYTAEALLKSLEQVLASVTIGS
jgi:PAS domain S-box-containing protein